MRPRPSPRERSSWSTNERTTANDAGQTNLGCPCAFRYSSLTLRAASISFCDTHALGVNSKMSRPRAISELTMTPLYQ